MQLNEPIAINLVLVLLLVAIGILVASSTSKETAVRVGWSSFWSTAITRRRSGTSFSPSSRALCCRPGKPPPRVPAARYSCWLGAVSSKDILSIPRSAMRSFAAGNIWSVGAAAIEILFALNDRAQFIDQQFRTLRAQE